LAVGSVSPRAMAANTRSVFNSTGTMCGRVAASRVLVFSFWLLFPY
jgi:hypothetical protein